MPYGTLTDEMQQSLGPFVHGKEVWDLGAGDLEHAETLVALGATQVIAVDKTKMPKPLSNRIRAIWTYFANLDVPASGIRVAFIAWPINYIMPELFPILEQSDVVVYLGSNTDGNSCGWKGLFHHLVTRELLVHIPHQRNTLIVVGKQLEEPREPTWEELAGLTGELLRFSNRPST